MVINNKNKTLLEKLTGEYDGAKLVYKFVLDYYCPKKARKYQAFNAENF